MAKTERLTKLEKVSKAVEDSKKAEQKAKLTKAIDKKKAGKTAETKPSKIQDAEFLPVSEEDAREIAGELAAVEAELAALEAEPPAPEPEAEGKPGKAKKEKTPRKAAKESRQAGDVITAKELASDIGVEPRILRRTLRKLEKDKKITAKDGRWEWAPGHADIEVVRQALTKA